MKRIFRINIFDDKNSPIHLLSNKILLTPSFQRRKTQNSRDLKEYFWPLKKEKGREAPEGMEDVELGEIEIPTLGEVPKLQKTFFEFSDPRCAP